MGALELASIELEIMLDELLLGSELELAGVLEAIAWLEDDGVAMLLMALELPGVAPPLQADNAIALEMMKLTCKALSNFEVG